MRTRAALAAGLAGAGLLNGCSPDAPPRPTGWHDEGSYRWRELAVPERGDVGFTPLDARRTGVAFSNRLAAETAIERDHLLIGSGVAVGDVDGDGLADLYFARLEGDNALYRNTGGWRFEDVTAAAGVAAPDRHSTGAAFADVDGDGWLDLFVTALGGPDALFRNRGDGTFEDVTAASGLESRLGSTSATFADVEGDGDLDLYVATYKVESAADVLRPYERPSMDLVVEREGVSEVAEPFREHFRMEERGGRRFPAEQADPDRLYLNAGDGRFEPVPWDGGRFLTAEGTPLERDLDDFALAARFYDVDGDGDPDLYVCDDFDDPDHFWINDGSGVFRAVGAHALRTTSHASMAVDFADIDRDGDVDLFVADMLSPDPARRLVQVPLHGPLEKPPGRIDDRPQVGRNTLFLSRGDGTWAQIAELAGVDGSEWSWGTAFVDVDLDGYEDLLVANGHGRDMQDGDALERISNLRGSVTWADAKALYPRRPTRNLAFRNRGDRTFEAVGEAWDVGPAPDISHGLATGDLDGDGDLDVVVNRLGSPALLLRNDATAGRVAVRLQGEAPNTRGVGARVRLHGGDLPPQEREVTAGGLYLSGAEPLISFAAREGADLTLEVVWRDGSRSRIDGVRADRLYEVREAGAAPAPAVTPGGGAVGPGTAGPDVESSRSRAERPLFVDVSDRLGHVHHEDDFDDFARQPLLPYRLSRLGPGVTWADLDADGDPDLVVGTGRGGTVAVLRNEGGTAFTGLAGAPSPHDVTAVLPVRAGGAVTLLLGRTSYDAGGPEEARTLAGVVRSGWPPGSHEAEVASGHLSSVGPLAQADVDGDGDLDLFVGGRSVPAFYPLPASSRLFLNHDGVLREDAVAGEGPFRDVGLVSGAVFTDLERDGDPDLVLAVEWGAPRVLVNEGGTFSDRTDAWGIGGLTGLWAGVTAGDLDGDGRFDLVLTNRGRNTRLQTSAERPLAVVHGDPDRNGTWEVVQARAREPGGPLHPLVRYEQVRSAVPSLRSRVATFAEYGAATVGTVLGGDGASTFRLEAAILDHVALLDRGGTFEVVPLPPEAQLAPAHHVGVADVDGDGHEDVFLSQNLYPTGPFDPRWAEGRSLLLRGDGAGGLEPVPGVASGLEVYGDQRGAAFGDFDRDGRVDLAVSQNGAATKLYRNVGARPGLRVRLEGPPSNPTAVGAVVRVLYGERPGPAREIRSGSGYWSVDDPVQILGLDGTPTGVRVVWPGGATTEAPVPEGAGEVVVRTPSG